MNIEDKFFDKIKQAANQDSIENFEGMDKIWQKIDDKLETKSLKISKNHWKKFGIAASFLLAVTFGLILFNLQKEVNLKEELNIPIKNNTIVKDTLGIKKTIEIEKNEMVTNEKVENSINSEVKNNSIEKDEGYLDINPNSNIALVEETSNEKAKLDEPKKTMEREIYGYKTTTIVTDRVVKSVNPNAKEVAEIEVKQQEPKKLNPLVVIDGNVAKNGKKAMQEVEVESLVELKEPLYIINGIHYSEQEMFGPKPTSPYAPLDKQDITSIKILLEEEAVKIYGEKGKKGVVIVTTKNNKPKQ